MSLSQTRGNLFYGRDVETFLRQRRGNLLGRQTRGNLFSSFARETWKPFAKVSTCLRVKRVSPSPPWSAAGNRWYKKSLKGSHVSLVHLATPEEGVALLLLLSTPCSAAPKYRENILGVPAKGSPVSHVAQFRKGSPVSASVPKKVSPSLRSRLKGFPGTMWVVQQYRPLTKTNGVTLEDPGGSGAKRHFA